MQPEVVSTSTPSSVVPSKRSSRRNLWLAVGCIVAAIIIALAGLTIMAILRLKNNAIGDNSQQQADDAAGIEQTALEKITVVTPTAGDEIDGSVTVAGIAEGEFEEVVVEIQNADGEILGKGIALLDKVEGEEETAWEIDVNIVTSPASKLGSVVVYPATVAADSPLTKKIQINFMSAEEPGRLVIHAPLSQQVTAEDSVLIRGEMQDFFEGTMGIRLVNANGGTLFEGTITAADNYGQFVEFEEEVDYGDIPLAAGDEGEWQFFEQSAKDGSERILVTVPVRFSE